MGPLIYVLSPAAGHPPIAVPDDAGAGLAHAFREEVAEQITQLRKSAAELGENFDRYTVSYQVTMNIGDSAERAKTAFSEYISKRFNAAGVDHFICRFGALDQFGQVERFAADEFPALT